MKIKLVDLSANYHSIKDEIDMAMAEVIENTAFVMGPYVEEFESKWATYCGVENAIGVASGTDAVRLAVNGLGIGPGDEVITVSNTFIATAEAVSANGATPVFVDVDRDTFCLDAARIESALTKWTKAVLCVHLYGHPCDMDEIMRIASVNNLFVIEDCAQSHGALYKGRQTGSIGDVGCFSMFPAKILGAFGDAGAIVTNRNDVADRIRLQRNHGRTSKYNSIVEGGNARLDALQAGILAVKLKHLDKWISSRRALAARYHENLAGVVETPIERQWATHPYYMYVIRTPKRDTLLTHLQSRHIECGIHYPIPLHLQQAYSRMNLRSGSLPVTEQAANEILSIPLFPEMNIETQDKVIASILEFF